MVYFHSIEFISKKCFGVNLSRLQLRYTNKNLKYKCALSVANIIAWNGTVTRDQISKEDVYLSFDTNDIERH